MSQLTGSGARRIRRVRDGLWLVQGGLCYWCGERMLRTWGDRGLEASVEHIRPIGEGGSATRTRNLAVAHAECNNRRSARLPDPNSRTSMKRRLRAMSDPGSDMARVARGASGVVA